MSEDYPTVTSVSIEPTNLRPRQSQIRVSSTIAYSQNITSVKYNISGPGPGNYILLDQDATAALESGTPQSGTWVGTLVIPDWLPDGEYAINYIWEEQNGQLNQDQLDSSFISRRFNTGDILKPSLIAIQVNPNILEGDVVEVRVAARVTDDIGVVHVYARAVSLFRLSTPGFAPTTYFTRSHHLSLEEGGTPQSGTWSGVLLFRPGIPEGDYSVSFWAYDAAGNVASSYVQDAPTHVVTIRRTPSSETEDNISPTFVTNPAVEPASVGQGISQITITARVLDNVAVNSLSASISTNSRQIGTAVLSLRDGTPQDGLWAGTFDFPLDLPDGQYEVSLLATDTSKNSTKGKPATVSLHRSPRPVPTEERQITISYNGEACIACISTQDGKSHIQITFTGPVTFNCCKTA